MDITKLAEAIYVLSLAIGFGLIVIGGASVLLYALYRYVEDNKQR